MLFLFSIMAALQVQAAPAMTSLKVQEVGIVLTGGSGCYDEGRKSSLLSHFVLFLNPGK